MKRSLAPALLICLTSMPAWAESHVSLTQTQWIATRINGNPISGEPPTLTIEQNRAYGSSGCNRFTGKATASDKGNLQLGPLASTRMACPGNADEQEAAYFKALHSVTAYHLNQNDLILLDKDFNKIVEFRTTPESPPR